MGRKSKKIHIKLSDQELVPSTIGILEETKSGFVSLVIFFLIFILFAVFLPNINNYVNKLLGKDDNVIIPSQIEEPQDDKKDYEKLASESKLYDVPTENKFSFNGLEINKVYFEDWNTNYVIHVNAENNSNKEINLKNEVYYIELYDINSTFLKRYLMQKSIIKVGDTYNFTQTIPLDVYNNAKKIKIVKRVIDDYPSFDLEFNSGDLAVLTCQGADDLIDGSLIYTFNKKMQLVKVRQNYSSTIGSINLSLFSEKINSYNKYNGVTSNFISNNNIFTYTIDIDFETVDIDVMKKDNNYNEAFYDKNTLPKVIKFEMESRGYTCQ